MRVVNLTPFRKPDLVLTLSALMPRKSKNHIPTHPGLYLVVCRESLMPLYGGRSENLRNRIRAHFVYRDIAFGSELHGPSQYGFALSGAVEFSYSFDERGIKISDWKDFLFLWKIDALDLKTQERNMLEWFAPNENSHYGKPKNVNSAVAISKPRAHLASV